MKNYKPNLSITISLNAGQQIAPRLTSYNSEIPWYRKSIVVNRNEWTVMLLLGHTSSLLQLSITNFCLKIKPTWNWIEIWFDSRIRTIDLQRKDTHAHLYWRINRPLYTNTLEQTKFTFLPANKRYHRKSNYSKSMGKALTVCCCPFIIGIVFCVTKKDTTNSMALISGLVMCRGID